jgi:hypothetical protein
VQRALERPRDAAALEPVRGLRGQEGLAHLTYLDGIGRVGAQAALWNGERDVDRRALGPIAA